MKKSVIFSLLVLFSACVHRSNDAMLDVPKLWVGSDYILSRSGNSESLALLQAERLVHKKDYRRAWHIINNDNLRYVVNPDVAFIKGKIQYALGDFGRSVKYLEDAEQLGYSSNELYELLARVNLALQSEEKALGITEILVEQDRNASTMNLHAQVLFATGDTLNAIKFYNGSIKADSSMKSNYQGLGEILLVTDNLEKADVLLSKGVERFPQDEDLIRLYASINESRGQYKEAIRLTSQLVSSNRNDAALLAWRAQLYSKNRQYDSAVYAATASLLFSESAQTQLVLADALERQRLYNDALSVYQKVVAADSTNTTAAAGVQRLEGRRRYLDAIRRQQQDPIRSEPPSDSTSSNSN